tara:strand:+ start:601 stop:1182 length:582 start_codon:yes stop_codon:yes gene_type:complete
MINLDLYFPTPVWWTDTNLDNGYLKDIVYNKKIDFPEGREISNYGGWQSNVFPSSHVPPLCDVAIQIADQVKEDMGLNPYTAFDVDNLWCNINNQGNSNQIHIHHGSFLSGVYYVQANENSGDLIFYKDFNKQYMKTTDTEIVKHTPLTGDVVRYKPKTGRMFVFPGWLPHSVDKCIDNTDRVSIAFNISIKK